MIVHDKELGSRLEKILTSIAMLLVREKELKELNLNKLTHIPLGEVQTIYDLLLDLKKDRDFQYRTLERFAERLNIVNELTGEFK